MTDNFKTECKHMAYKNRLGKINLGTEIITNYDYLSSIQFIDSCESNGTIIGNTNAKSILIKTIGKTFNFTDELIQAFIGVKYADKSDEYISIGKYSKFEQTNDVTSKNGEYKGVDDFNELDVAYECHIEDLENATIADFYDDVCMQIGLEPKTLEFLNSDIKIGGNPFTNNETRRTVLQNVAQVACSFYDVDRETNKIDLTWLDEEVTDVINKNNYTTLEKNKIYGPINSVVIKESAIEGENVTRQDEDSIEENGETQISIEDNYFLYTEELKTQAIDNIYNRLHGLTYVDCKLISYTGFPYLKRGNKISIQDDDNSFFDTYVLSHTFTYDGTFTSIIESPSLMTSQTAMKNTQSITNKMRRVERVANKIEGLVSDLVETIDVLQNDTDGKITEITNSVQQILDSTSAKIEVIEKKVTDGVETLKNSLVTIDINGITVSTNLSAISTIMTNDTFAIKSGDTYLAYFGYDKKLQTTVAKMDNLTVENYFVSGYHRTEKFEPDYEKRTGVFYVGGSY